MFKVFVVIFVAFFFNHSEANDIDPESLQVVAAHIGFPTEPTGT